MNDWKALLGEKIDVSIEKKNTFNTWSLKLVTNCEMISNTKFKARVKDLLDLFIVINILAMLFESSKCSLMISNVKS